MPEKPFRRPTPKWCTETAIRLLRIGAGETFRTDSLLDIEAAEKFIEMAKLLDRYGQQIKATKE